MNKFLSWFKINYRNSDFTKNALLLTFGTVLAQILPILFYPLLGRIYDPTDFGLLATILAIIPFVTIIASGMYENAILLADSKQESADLIGFIFLRSLLLSLVIGFILNIFSSQISSWFNEPELSNWLFVIPISAFATVIYNCFNEWCVRNKYFLNLSFNKIYNTSSVTLSKVTFGVFRLVNNGLIFGDLLGRTFTALLCIYKAIQLDKSFFQQIKIKNFKILSKKFSNFSAYLVPDQILNYIAGSMHIFFIASYFSINELGHFSIAASLLTVPVTVISSSIKDVFRQKANEEFVLTGSCRSTYLRLLKPVTIFSLLLFIPLYFILPSVFTLFMGSKWITAGYYSQLLLPMFAMNFISMSVGGVLIITNNIKISLYWQIFTIVATIVSFYIGIFWFKTIEATLVSFMIARSIGYLLHIIISYYYTKEVTI